MILESMGLNVFSNYFSSSFQAMLCIGYDEGIIQNNTIENCNYGISIKDTLSCNYSVLNNNLNNGYYGFKIEDCEGKRNSIIKDNIISNMSGYGIGIGNSLVTLENNSLLNSSIGASISHDNFISDLFYKITNNSFYSCDTGFSCNHLTDLIFISNTISNNHEGVAFYGSSDVIIMGNFFIDNDVHANYIADLQIFGEYPLGGNYWSDYNGRDVMKGRQQDQDGSDGIGDTPYTIYDNVKDIYPIFIDTEPPSCVQLYNITLDLGAVYHFDAGMSTDDQLVHRVHWEYEFGGEDHTSDQFSFDLKFDVPGYYNVSLVIYDYAGNSDHDFMVITVKDDEAPIPIYSGDIQIIQGETATFNGSGSTDQFEIRNISWSFVYEKEDYRFYGPVAEFTFDIPGIYPITWIMVDEWYNQRRVVFNLTVLDIEAPICIAGDDVTIDNGEVFIFDGDNCTDNGRIVKYNWSFEYEDDIISLKIKEPSFVFTIPGVYDILLEVEDQFGNRANDSFILTVVDTIPPEAVINGDLVIFPGDRLILDGSSSFDNGEIVRYLWTFDDDGPVEISGMNLDHELKVTSDRVVYLTVWDRAGFNHTTSVTITILDTSNPVAIAVEEISIPVGQIYKFNGTASTDDGMIVAYEWDFVYDLEEVTLYGPLASFTFNIPGVYDIILTVFDQSDNNDDTTITLTVISTGSFSGQIVDEKEVPIKGVKVLLTASNGDEYKELTDHDGEFHFKNISMGTYQYRIWGSGYEPIEGTLEIRPMENSALDSSNSMLSGSPAGEDHTMLFAILGVIFLIIIIIVVLLVMKKRSGSGNEDGKPIPEEHLEIKEDEILKLKYIQDGLEEQIQSSQEPLINTEAISPEDENNEFMGSGEINQPQGSFEETPFLDENMIVSEE